MRRLAFVRVTGTAIDARTLAHAAGTVDVIVITVSAS
jgi:hypothetical protein